MKMKNLFADIGDRVVLQLPDTQDVREGRVKRPRRGHIHNHWSGKADGYVKFYLYCRRGRIFLQDLWAQTETEHDTIESAQSAAAAILKAAT